MSKGEGTEKPTQKRMREARQEGQLPRTPELGAWGALLAAGFVLPHAASAVLQLGQQLLAQAARFPSDPDPAVAMHMLTEALKSAALIVAPVAGTVLLVALASAGAQGGLRPAMKLAKPKFSRLNPLHGLKRIAGPSSVWEAIKTVLKTSAVGVALYLSVRGLVPTVLASGSLPLPVLVATVTNAAAGLIRAAGLAGLLLAGVDYAVARRRSMKQLRMTRQQIKDEHRTTEGDPQLRGAIRSRQLAMSRRRMMTDLLGADTVVVNPTHVAVALRYEPARGAPIVVAKGADKLAARIRELATEHRIPMIRDVPLARALYQDCEVGDQIPPQLYDAVARVLAFLFAMRRRSRPPAAAPAARPMPVAPAPRPYLPPPALAPAARPPARPAA